MAVAIWFAIIIAAICIMQYLKARKYPPGPFPIPLVGTLPQFLISAARGRPVAHQLLDLKKRYGSVYTIWIGPVPAVLVCSYDLIVEHFLKNGEIFSGRWRPYLQETTRGGNFGVLHADGPAWKEQRRFSLHVLRDFGFGRNLMEQKILEETHTQADRLGRMVENAGGVADVELGEIFDLLVGSVINKVLAGYGFDEKNTNEFLSLKHHFDDYATNFNVLDQLIYNDFTIKLPYIRELWRRRTSPLLAIRKHMKTTIECHRQDFDPDQEPNDFIEAFFREQKRREKDGDAGSFSMDQLVSLCQDLWMAGMETTVTTLNWAIIYLLNRPDAQERARSEIDRVVGVDRDVLLEDRKQLPYTSAVCLETHRLASILNFNLWHRLLSDTVIDGKPIERETICTQQISVMFLDETVFENPDEFQPERFLDPINGKSLEQKIIPFGVGKRSCLGESLARAEFFLVLANFLKRFTFSPVPNQAIPSMEPFKNMGFLHRPKPYTCVVGRRN